MDCNREEALRAKEMAEKKMENKDFSGALKIALKAQQLYPDLENVSQMIVVCEVHCSAENKIYNTTTEKDWYSILKIDPSADDLSIKKQYRKLALILHPDKNKFSGSADAFKLIGEAQRVLLDREKRMIHDSKSKAYRNFPKPRPNYGQHPWTQSNFTQAQPHFPNNYNTTGVHSVNLQHRGARQTFWTACPFCHIRYQYYRDDVINKVIDCQNCKKTFSAYETNVQAAAAAGTNQRPSFFPQQNKAPFAGSGSMNHNFTSKPVFSGDNYQAKETSKAEVKVNRKRKKKVEESSGSDDSTSSSEEEDFVPKEEDDNNDYPSNQYFSEQPRRSTRAKRNISYRENLSDNDDDDEKSVEETLPKEDKKNKFEHEKHFDPNPDSKLRENVKEDEKKEEIEPEVYECPDPDFSDFDKERREESFSAGQIWAIYDNEDAMPRFYALIKKVLSPGFKLQIAWLEFIPANKQESKWFANDLPVSCGKFKPGKSEKAEDLPMFSHLVSWGHKCIQGETYEIYPKTGETWALFKNWNINWVSSTTLDDTEKYEYDFVEILSDYDDNNGVHISYLEKVKSFTCLFRRKVEDDAAASVVMPNEKLRFSHRVPSCRLTGEEREGVPKGSYELDPASLPTSTFEQVFL